MEAAQNYSNNTTAIINSLTSFYKNCGTGIS